MLEIIPAVNVHNFEELEERIKKVEPYVRWAQIDVEDGQFIQRKTWNNPGELVEFETPLDLEIHLMIEKPERAIDAWTKVPAERLIFHFEATDDAYGVINKIHAAGKSAGVAINPDTSWEELKPFIYTIDEVLVMGVDPGPSGQKFQKKVLFKIESLHEVYPNVTIGIDGGISEENVEAVVGAGVDRVASGNYIFSSQDIKKAIDTLRSAGLAGLNSRV